MTTSFHVSQLGSNDEGTMRAMLTMFGHAFGDVPTYCDKQPSAAYLRRLLKRDTFIAFAAIARDGTVVGGIAAYVLDKFEQARSEIYIYDLAVALPYRRQGVATALIRALQAIARQRGSYVIFVQADLIDAPAIALYSKLGTREDVLHFDVEVAPASGGRR